MYLSYKLVKTAVQCLGTCLYDLRGLKRSVIVASGHQIKTKHVALCMAACVLVVTRYFE